MALYWFRGGIIFITMTLVLACGLSGTAAAKEINRDLIIVNKKTNELAFFQDGMLVRQFSVATGRTLSLTPEGTFKIVNKIKNRPYYKDKIKGGDPENPLGDRWLGLEVNGTYGTTYAIHGNNNSNSIGKYVSSGCIRMHNEEIHWLFEQVKLETKVIITNSEDSFIEIASNSEYPYIKAYAGTFMIDGAPVEGEENFILHRDKLYVPLRQSFVHWGGKLIWNQQTQTAAAILGDIEIVHQPGTKTATVNGEPYELAGESYVLNETTMIPVRDLARMAGYDVVWDAAASTLMLHSAAPVNPPAPTP